MYRLLLVSVLLCIPVIGYAAYQDPTLVSKEPQPTGFWKLVYEFVGNAGEPPKRREYLVRPDTTREHAENWVFETKQELDRLHLAGQLPALQPGAVLQGKQAPAQTLAPCERWMQKYDRYKYLAGNGLISAALTADLNTLKTNLESTYPTGCILQ